MTGIPIQLGDDTLAVMTFNYDERSEHTLREPLFKSICSQIAITVSNIIASEKINNQLTEISSYKQQLEQEKLYLKEEIATTQNYADIIGDGPEMKKSVQDGGTGCLFVEYCITPRGDWHWQGIGCTRYS